MLKEQEAANIEKPRKKLERVVSANASIGHNGGPELSEPAPVKVKKPRAKKQRNTSRDFVNNAMLLEEIIKSKARLAEDPGMKLDAMTKELTRMLNIMVFRYSNKPSFIGYSYKDEMCADALLNLCAKWDKFDENRFTNAFAYYTTLIHNCFLGTLAKEKKQARIRDAILESRGMTPSFGRQMDTDD